MSRSECSAREVTPVEGIRVIPLDRNRTEVSALFGGRSVRYCVPALHLSRQAIGDALLASVLPPAMRLGTSIHLPEEMSVSSLLAAELDGIQRVLIGWNHDLKKVGLEAQLYEPVNANGPVGLFFAGGVDSSYSLLSHFEEIDALVIVFGFDHSMSDQEKRESIERNGLLAKRLGKELIVVETNHSRFLADLGVSRTFVYAATLAAIAELLGLRRCYVASSHSCSHLRPNGSHFALDPRFSNGATEIIHDDISVSRLEKTRAVAAHPELLENLRVCWEYPNHNCGECPKCLRTMTALWLCGAAGPFPPLGVHRVCEMAAQSEIEYVMSMLLAARAQGEVEVERELRKGLRRQDWGETLRYLDHALTGGRLLRLRRSRSAEANLVKVNLRPDIDLH
jgi:hypothetical protein